MLKTVDPIAESLTYHLELGEIRQQLGMKPMRERNIGDSERLACIISGGALTILGLSRRSPMGLALGLLGGVLANRGISGRCPVYKRLNINTR